MLDVMFLMGLAAGAIIGGIGMVYLTERRMDDDLQDWEDALSEQQGHAGPVSDAPVAVTKLTNRERTVEL